MITNPYTWELDSTGASSANLVTAERHSLSIDSGNGFHFFIPKAAPFFLTNIKIVHVATGRELKLDVDWSPGWEFTLATRRVYKPVYGCIVILDKTLNGTFEIQYQTLGGEYTYDDQTLLTYLLNVALDPRITTWEAVVDKPLYFTPIEHVFSVDDLVGADAMVEALDRIRDAILSSIETIYPSLGVHIRNLENPHATTKAQVGLGLVENFPMASDAEAVDGTLRNRYMSPATTKALLAQLSSETVAGHASNFNNPHHVTPAQIGLGLVQNYAVATVAQALQGTASNLYMTPETTKALVLQLAVGDFSNHLADYVNPHQTTKAQVGLGSVANYPIADSATLDAGTSNVHYTTPGGVTQMINKQVGADFAIHLADKTNPHATTKTQVGLGLVQNYGIASSAELDAGVASDKYVVVAGVKQMIDKFANASVAAHVADLSNPHGTTKAQVGLGLVDNFATATQVDAETGTANNLFVTPLRVAQAIAKLALIPLGLHTARTDNPHSTTATQVGLGNVSNFLVATQLEAETGTSDTVYMTALKVKQAIVKLANATVSTHLSDLSNPHQTTKAQVGLGSVLNYGISDQATAEAGTSDLYYMTPLKVSLAIAKQALVPLTTHALDQTNPHATTKTQVGLGSVQNYGIATQAEAEAGTVNTTYMTPLRVSQAITVLAITPLTNHANRIDNPHSVTKTQIGLSNVQNYSIADQATAEAGTSDIVYMTPLKVAQAIAKLANGTVSNHLGDYNNPHQTTKAQIGLGLVDNFGTATIAETEAGTANDLFATPAGVAQAIQTIAVTPLNQHLSAVNNPHAVDKLQVGLGDVDNFATALQADAEAGVSNVLFMTPLTVFQAISKFALTPLGVHVTNTSNPHATTKAQVGLGNVDNYLTATQVEAEAGTSGTVFMTALRVSQAITKLALAPLAVHTSNTSNPHSTTKAQVGLGSVLNYAVATQAEAEAGAVDTSYMTPLKTAQAIAKQINPQVTSDLLKLQRTVMRQAFNLSIGMLQAGDAVAGVTAATIFEQSLAALVTTDDATNHNYSWSGNFTVGVGVTARLLLSGVYLWDGARATLTVGGTTVINDTLVDPVKYFDQVTLPVGTNAVVLTIVSPKTVLAPDFSEAVLRSESLT